MPDPVVGCDVLNRSSLYFSYDQEVSTHYENTLQNDEKITSKESLEKYNTVRIFPNHAPQVIKQLPITINEQLSKNFFLF